MTKTDGFSDPNAERASSSMLFEIDALPEPDAIVLPYEDDGIERPRESWISLNGQATVRNVARPTLTPVLPNPQTATGAAMIVAPGGGFLVGSMENEGWPVARWLADRGIAAFILKYRLEPTPEPLDAFRVAMIQRFAAAATGSSELKIPRYAVADAQAAVRMIRERSADWGVVPDRMGFLGFSAGAIVGIQAVLRANPGTRPDFLAAIYPAMRRVAVPDNAPPLFVAIAADDPLWRSHEFNLVQAWWDAGRSAELHCYRHGGHGFGMGNPQTTSAGWLDSLERWLASHDFDRV